MKQILIAAGCILAMVTGLAQAQERPLRIAFDVPYEPFEYRTPDGELTGFEVELAEAMCEEMNRECDFVVQAWDGMIPGLMARKYDAIMSSMSITEQRAKRVLFSDPYYRTPGGWFGKKDTNVDVSDRSAMEGMVVGVQRGTTMDNYVTENLGGIVEVKRYTTADDMALDLESDRLDLVFVDYPVGEEYFLTRDNFKEIGEPVKLGKGVAVAMRKRDKALAKEINKALETLKNDGTYDAIMNRYFDYSIKM
ncbi:MULTISPECIES: transporter substrate-binding domain-containing protein [Halomonadaceae]|uniref:Transporter substrate-binding domain-containing protein n=1 Tax=Vreelandella halophila TaxID=86177 RepID=A0A9X5B6U7_9GAMM|nr:MULTISPECIES: transporter substrate-binding domain-containing protein [Halomonas]MYL27868.1 transporter substrate-binding domain-containing protein [Halomonas utahensis]MYL74994.1 transporter substrate-binding domain-containing protein [Halomonas sp. 22501_18_FS]